MLFSKPILVINNVTFLSILINLQTSKSGTESNRTLLSLVVQSRTELYCLWWYRVEQNSTVPSGTELNRTLLSLMCYRVEQNSTDSSGTELNRLLLTLVVQS
ncbi:hypothetical protein RRG08_002780 [Elysia crispata]|uniref:Uncharacterized protein n=1 Tax=Elysia crispata TaxID=231223 RepID=A0AAE1CMD8_9GAST|nr:hypothetical protein RRG08_002780 [Elysia crispata]